MLGLEIIIASCHVERRDDFEVVTVNDLTDNSTLVILGIEMGGSGHRLAKRSKKCYQLLKHIWLA